MANQNFGVNLVWSDNAWNSTKNSTSVKPYLFPFRENKDQAKCCNKHNKDNYNTNSYLHTSCLSVFAKNNPWMHIFNKFNEGPEADTIHLFSIHKFPSDNPFKSEAKIEQIINRMVIGISRTTSVETECFFNEDDCNNSTDDKKDNTSYDYNSKGKVYCCEYNTENIFRFPLHELLKLHNDSNTKQMVEPYLFLDEENGQKTIIKELTADPAHDIYFKEKSRAIPDAVILIYMNKMLDLLNSMDSDLIQAIEDVSNNENWNYATNKQFLENEILKIKGEILSLEQPALPIFLNFLNELNNKFIDIKKWDKKRIWIVLNNKKKNTQAIEDIKNDINGINKIRLEWNNQSYSFNKNKNFLLLTAGKCYSYFEHLKDLIYCPIVDKNIFNMIDETIPCIECKQDIDSTYSFYEEFISGENGPFLTFEDIDWGVKIKFISDNNIPTQNYQTLLNTLNNNNAFKNILENPLRFRALMIEYIKYQENQTGNIWVSIDEMHNFICNRLLYLDGFAFNFDIADLLKNNNVKKKVIYKEISGKIFITTTKLNNQEEFINNIINGKVNKGIKNLPVSINIGLKNDQKGAYSKMINNQFTFLSGVAGAGKSYVIGKFIEYLKNTKEDYHIFTPTGKAAQVLKADKNIDDDKVTTLHNYMSNKKVLTLVNGKFIFKEIENIENIIVDEVSMFTLEMFYFLLKNTFATKRLIIVGDIKQLPPIGYGSISNSIYRFLKKQHKNNLAELKISQRANKGSDFTKLSILLRKDINLLKQNDINVTNQTNINWDEEFQDFISSHKTNQSDLKFFINGEYQYKHTKAIDRAFKIIEKIYQKDTKKNKPPLAQYLAENIDTVQILTLNNIGDYGVDKINEQIIIKLGIKDNKYKKIMITKNKKDLSNGDIGYINGNKKLCIYNKKYKENEYSTKDVYAMTIHKSQGSGFDHVIIIMPPDAEKNRLLSNELFYTAITRAKKKVYILCENTNFLNNMKHTNLRNSLIFKTDKEHLDLIPSTYGSFKYKNITYKNKSTLYTAILLNNCNKKFTHSDCGTFSINNSSITFNPKSYIKIKNLSKKENNIEIFYTSKEVDFKKMFEDLKICNNSHDRTSENKDDFMRQKWITDIIEKNEYIQQDNGLDIIAHNGLKTRSYSEAILMALMDELGIKYFYESEIWFNQQGNIKYQITFDDSKKPDNHERILPDFAISNQIFDKQDNVFEINAPKFLIEHLGMLNDKEYLKRWKGKVGTYNKLGYKVVPISSLNNNFFGMEWREDKNEPQNCNPCLICNDTKFCITTDEKDFEDLTNLINLLTKLKQCEIYSKKVDNKVVTI